VTKLLLMAGVCIGLIASVANSARADLLFSKTGSNSDGALSASADFSLTGNVLTIVLINLDPTKAQGDVLTNLGVTTAPATAQALPGVDGTIAVSAGSGWLAGGLTATNFQLGQNWAYIAGSGVASSGFGVGTGHGNLCGTPGNCGSIALDGADFGIVGPGTNVNSPGLQGPSDHYVQNSVTVTLTLAPGFSLSSITAVDFQFGTSPGEGDITDSKCQGGTDCTVTTFSSAPEPASLTILGVGLIGLAGVMAKRR
jgi:hypothetical protein